MFAVVSDGRQQFADLVDGLCGPQLASPSQCAAWNIKTVRANTVSTISDGTPPFFGVDSAMEHVRGIVALAQRRAVQSASEIAAHIHRIADRPVSPPVAGPPDPLADVLVINSGTQPTATLGFVRNTLLRGAIQTKRKTPTSANGSHRFDLRQPLKNLLLGIEAPASRVIEMSRASDVCRSWMQQRPTARGSCRNRLSTAQSVRDEGELPFVFPAWTGPRRDPRSPVILG